MNSEKKIKKEIPYFVIKSEIKKSYDENSLKQINKIKVNYMENLIMAKTKEENSNFKSFSCRNRPQSATTDRFCGVSGNKNRKNVVYFLMISF